MSCGGLDCCGVFPLLLPALRASGVMSFCTAVLTSLLSDTACTSSRSSAHGLGSARAARGTHHTLAPTIASPKRAARSTVTPCRGMAVMLSAIPRQSGKHCPVGLLERPARLPHSPRAAAGGGDGNHLGQMVAAQVRAHRPRAAPGQVAVRQSDVRCRETGALAVAGARGDTGVQNVPALAGAVLLDEGPDPVRV